jgi:hypothetical protein
LVKECDDVDDKEIKECGKLKLSVYIKYNFHHIWECRYPPILKGIHIPTKLGM